MNLSCSDIVKYDDRLFILTRDSQYLLEYYPASGKIDLCGMVADNLKQFFASMVVCGDKIYIAPYNADVFCIYDINKREIQRIPLKKKDERKGGKRGKYKICFSYRQKVYFLGGKGVTMLCIDTNTNVVEEITEWYDEFRRKFGFDTWVRTHQHICIVQQSLWIALEGNNVLMQYNLLTGEFFFWTVGTKKRQYVTVNFDGEYFWLSGEEKVIVRWKKETDEVKEFTDFPKGFKTGDRKDGWKELFSYGYIWNDNIYFAPLNSNMLIKFDLISCQMKCIIETDLNHVCFILAEINDQELYMEEDKAETLLVDRAYFINKIDACTGGSICIKECDCGNFKIENMWIEDNVIKEWFPQCISKLICMLKEDTTEPQGVNHSNTGRNIWKHIV